MNSLNNRVQLLGRLGAEPEIKSFGKEKKMARLSIATSDKYKDAKGEIVEDTQWHNLVIWNTGLVGITEKFLKKGSQIIVEGKLSYRQWENDEGKKQYITEITVNEIQMLAPAKA